MEQNKVSSMPSARSATPREKKEKPIFCAWLVVIRPESCIFVVKTNQHG